MDAQSRSGRGLVLLGSVALLRAACTGPDAVPPGVAGEIVELRLESLAGAEFRLLPGVGPVLAARLEAARVAAGGRLDEAAAAEVKGVGESLLARWRTLRPP